MVAAREQDFWLKHKELVNTNLAEIHCTEQSSAFLPAGLYFPQRQVSELISLFFFFLPLSLYWQCTQARVQHINLVFVSSSAHTLWAALCRANSFSQQLCAKVLLQEDKLFFLKAQLPEDASSSCGTGSSQNFL